MSFWGYPQGTVCSDGNAMDSVWMSVTEAVYRAPLSHLHTGEVLVRSDLVVIAGQTSTRTHRDEIESAVRANLAAAGLSKIPMIVQIEVTTDPLLTESCARSLFTSRSRPRTFHRRDPCAAALVPELRATTCKSSSSATRTRPAAWRRTTTCRTAR